jgi:dTDP-4-dehydrorhamnose 3,5-epimerase
MTDFGKSLQAQSTPIPGLTVWTLPVHGDNRGWFKENWQREKMVAAGLPDFGPVQNNVSFNDNVGTTRGIHAEPWDKFVSVATGRIFGAWVDLRSGPTFGVAFTAQIDPSRAVFVPRGVGNAFQTLEPNTAYVYLVNDHYSPDADYTSLHLGESCRRVRGDQVAHRPGECRIVGQGPRSPSAGGSQTHPTAQNRGYRGRWPAGSGSA